MKKQTGEHYTAAKILEEELSAEFVADNCGAETIVEVFGQW